MLGFDTEVEMIKSGDNIGFLIQPVFDSFVASWIGLSLWLLVDFGPEVFSQLDGTHLFWIFLDVTPGTNDVLARDVFAGPKWGSSPC